MKAVYQYDIKIEKEELIRALNYDRNQYNQGYDDGRRDAIASITRCKDCRYYKQNPYNRDCDMWCQYWNCWNATDVDDFCSHGENKNDDLSL
jgi:hypothetical protein